MKAASSEPSPQALTRLAAGLRTMSHDAAHGAGCGCCGRGPARIDAAAIELDVLAFLSMRYRQAGHIAGVTVAERWLAAPGPGLIALLRQGDGDGPPREEREKMIDDLLVILADATDPVAGGSRT